MSWLDFVSKLRSQGPVPTLSSPIYYVSAIVLAGLIVGLIFLNKKLNQIAYKSILLGMWIAMLGLEFFKQVMWCYAEIDGRLVFGYNYGSLPLHICSNALYVLPVLIFAKDGKIKKPFELYYSICSLFGGVSGVYFATFSPFIYTNIQTIIYHMLLTLSALLVGLRCRDRFKFNILGQAGLIHICYLLVVMYFNYFIPTSFPKSIHGNAVNFCAISWIYPPGGVPVLEPLWKAAPYPVYLFVYLTIHAGCCVVGYTLLSLMFNRKVSFKVREKEVIKNKQLASK